MLAGYSCVGLIYLKSFLVRPLYNAAFFNTQAVMNTNPFILFSLVFLMSCSSVYTESKHEDQKQHQEQNKEQQKKPTYKYRDKAKCTIDKGCVRGLL
jgi:amino acid permease